MSGSDPVDPDALFALARRRLHALDGPRDLAGAHEALRKAAGKGHAAAARARAHLIANGIGVRADPDTARKLLAKVAGRDAHAAAQLDILANVSAKREPLREPVSADPQIVLLGRLADPAECRHLMALAEGGLQPSFVIDPATGGRMPHPFRTSSGMNFGPMEEDLVVSRLNRRIAAATGTRVEAGEPLHILRYEPGQEYRPHLDALPGVCNQRVMTVLVYLNDGYRGGETDFPDLGIAIGGAAGDALMFRNADADGRPDPRTRHAGRPVTSGVKWIATRWIRAARHDPWEQSIGGTA